MQIFIEFFLVKIHRKLRRKLQLKFHEINIYISRFFLVYVVCEYAPLVFFWFNRFSVCS